MCPGSIRRCCTLRCTSRRSRRRSCSVRMRALRTCTSIRQSRCRSKCTIAPRGSSRTSLRTRRLRTADPSTSVGIACTTSPARCTARWRTTCRCTSVRDSLYCSCSGRSRTSCSMGMFDRRCSARRSCPARTSALRTALWTSCRFVPRRTSRSFRRIRRCRSCARCSCAYNYRRRSSRHSGRWSRRTPDNRRLCCSGSDRSSRRTSRPRRTARRASTWGDTRPASNPSTAPRRRLDPRKVHRRQGHTSARNLGAECRRRCESPRTRSPKDTSARRIRRRSREGTVLARNPSRR